MPDQIGDGWMPGGAMPGGMMPGGPVTASAPPLPALTAAPGGTWSQGPQLRQLHGPRARRGMWLQGPQLRQLRGPRGRRAAGEGF